MIEEKDLQAIAAKVGTEAAAQLKAEGDRIKAAVEKSVGDRFTELEKGQITKAQFEAFKEEAMGPVKEFTEKVSKLEEAMKAQGTTLTELKNNTPGRPKTMEEFITDIKPELDKAIKNKSYIEITGAQLKAAGITSITGSIGDMSVPPGSPYLPGLDGGRGLPSFDIVQNPNFILPKVDLGRTDRPIMAWINEISVSGDYVASANVLEGGLKPQVQHKFQLETSKAKKAAAWSELTEEFEDDVPGLATEVRRLLQQDVYRAWDNQIQSDVQGVARPFEITNFSSGNNRIDKANRYDAIGAMLAQVGIYNFVANTVALNPATLWGLYMQKAEVVTSGARQYINPPFLDRIDPKIVEAVKMANGFALVGDLKQYHVDVYKDFTLRIGWINDEFIYNKFAIVGELRYHSYISDNRKKAIVYSNLDTVISAINSGS